MTPSIGVVKNQMSMPSLVGAPDAPFAMFNQRFLARDCIGSPILTLLPDLPARYTEIQLQNACLSPFLLPFRQPGIIGSSSSNRRPTNNSGFLRRPVSDIYKQMANNYDQKAPNGINTRRAVRTRRKRHEALLED